MHTAPFLLAGPSGLRYADPRRAPLPGCHHTL